MKNSPGKHGWTFLGLAVLTVAVLGRVVGHEFLRLVDPVGTSAKIPAAAS